MYWLENSIYSIEDTVFDKIGKLTKARETYK